MANSNSETNENKPRHGAWRENVVGWAVVFFLFLMPLVLLPSAHDPSESVKRWWVITAVPLLWCFIFALGLPLRSIEWNPFSAGALWLTWVGLGVLSVAWATDRPLAAMHAAHLTACGGVFVLVRVFPQPERWLPRWWGALVAAGACAAGVGLLQHAGFDACFPQGASPASTFLNRNIAVDALAPLVPLAWACIGSSRGRFATAGWGAAVVLLMSYIICTGSRGGVLALAGMAVVAAFGVYRRWRDEVRRTRRSATVAMVAIAAGVLLLTAGLGIRGGYVRTAPDAHVRAGFFRPLPNHVPNDSFRLYRIDIRLTVWANTLCMIASRPVFGVGLGQWPVRFEPFRDDWELDPRRGMVDTTWCHNAWLQTAAELGVGGGVMLALVFALAFVRLFRHANDAHWPPGWALASALTAWTLLGWVSAPLQTAVPPVVLALLLATAEEEGVATTMSRWRGTARFGALTVCSLLAAGAVFATAHHLRYEKAYRSFVRAHTRGDLMAMEAEAAVLDATPPGRSDHDADLGWALIRMGRIEEGVTRVRRRLVVRPVEPRLWVMLGFGDMMRFRFPSALAAAEQALAIDPRHPEALDLRGRIFLKTGRPADAAEAFRRSLAVRNDPGTRRRLARALDRIPR